MDNLRNKIKSLIDSDDSIVNNLDTDDLHYIDDLMTELNKTGRPHSISKITRKGDALDIETNYKATYIKKLKTVGNK